MPYWHQVSDSYDKMDPEALGRAYVFTVAFLAAVDARAEEMLMPPRYSDRRLSSGPSIRIR